VAIEISPEVTRVRPDPRLTSDNPRALLAAGGGQRKLQAADRLCRKCVTLLDVDAAAISLVFDAAAEALAAEALVRLRAHAYATDRSAIDVARQTLDRRLRVEDD
jgi:hypothetical protein